MSPRPIPAPEARLEPAFLVVEDNPAHRQQMVRALSTVGSVVALARGEEVVAHLAAHRCDLVCLDLSLPEQSGYQVCAALRSAGHRTVVLVVSERLSVTDRAYAKEVGADDILEKPFRVRELMRRVDYLLRMGPVQPPLPPSNREAADG